MGFARLAEDGIRSLRDRPAGSPLTASDKVISSVIGGALGCWNHVCILLYCERNGNDDTEKRRYSEANRGCKS